MTFDEWWKEMKPAECDELKDEFVACWQARDAEVAELKAWNSELVKHQDKLADKCDELREQVALLRDALKYSRHQCEGLRVWAGMNWSYHPFQVKRIFDACEKALAVTKPKEEKE